MMSATVEIRNLVQETETMAKQTRETFSRLSDDQLNWKPGAEKWSVAQCFEHLLTTNKAYFPSLDSVLNGTKKTRVVEKLPVLPALWGKLLKKSVDPNTTRKLKAPRMIVPTSSNLSRAVLDDFINQQPIIARYLESLSKFDIDRIVVTSPFLSVMTLNVRDVCEIIVAHQKRHFQQARNVTNEPAFPQH